MSGQGPAADAAGNVFLVTGDGTSSGTTDFGNSVLKLKLVSGKLQILDWFTPASSEQLKALHADLGSGGALPVPNSHLLLTGGKEGRMYLLDRDDLRRGAKAPLHDFQVTNNPFRRVATPNGQEDILFWNLHGSPVIWPQPSHMYVYVMGEEDHLKQFKLIPDALAGWKFESDTPFMRSLESTPLPNPPNGLPNDKNRGLVWMPGGFLSLSADGDRAGPGSSGRRCPWPKMPISLWFGASSVRLTYLTSRTVRRASSGAARMKASRETAWECSLSSVRRLWPMARCTLPRFSRREWRMGSIRRCPGAICRLL